jgi:hypothetical protein
MHLLGVLRPITPTAAIIRLVGIAGIAVLTLWPVTGVAKEEACAQDIKRLCKDMQPGGGRIAKCLKEHEAELSSECKSHFTAAQKGEGPCKEDWEKFCKGVELGGGRVMKCLKEHEAELSPACKAQGAKAGK